MKSYNYVGPNELLRLVGKSSARCLVESQAAVLSWIAHTQQKLDGNSEVTATFIIDSRLQLWIADRHSEHVVCAQGGPVLSAGEMTFRAEKEAVDVVAVSNQSTGFCPEPESWPNVAAALSQVDWTYPKGFTTRFQFRRCDKCNSINIVKDDWFFCGVCDAQLNPDWNFGSNSKPLF